MKVHLSVVPYDSAMLDTRMGAGPRHLVGSGLADRLVACGHEPSVEEIAPPGDAPLAEIRTAFDLHRGIARSVAAARERGSFPITLAGNCNSAVGTLAGLGAGTTGVLWFDAHGDFNTPETTIGGFLDGMALAMATGHCWTQLTASVPGFVPVDTRDVILVGGRDLDPLEAELLAKSGVAHLRTDAAMSRLGDAIASLASRVGRLYVHVDLDVLDASEGLANAFAGGPGLSLADLLGAIEIAAARIPLAAAAVTAYDPSFDRTGSVCRAATAVVESITTLAGRPASGAERDRPVGAVRVGVERDADPADVEAVRLGLVAFNTTYIGPSEELPVAVFARDDQGRLVGGLVGYIKWRWLFVARLWVADSHRGMGHGRALLGAAEEHARAQGCLGAHLDTFEFQARPFYEKLGYTVFGTLDDIPPGYRQYHLFKRLPT